MCLVLYVPSWCFECERLFGSITLMMCSTTTLLIFTACIYSSCLLLPLSNWVHETFVLVPALISNQRTSPEIHLPFRPFSMPTLRPQRTIAPLPTGPRSIVGIKQNAVNQILCCIPRCGKLTVIKHWSSCYELLTPTAEFVGLEKGGEFEGKSCSRL
jgi:hypothetical protein